MKVHDDHLSPSDIQKVSHVFDDRWERGNPYDIVIDPESAYILPDRGIVWNRRVIAYPDIQIPNSVD